MIRTLIANHLRVVLPAAIAAVLTVSTAFGQATPILVPAPVSMQTTAGNFSIGPSTRIVADEAARGEADRLIDDLAPAMGFRLNLGDATGTSDIVLSLDAARQGRLGPEGYSLEVTPGRIDLRAAEPAGLFYAVQTLRQLLPAAVHGSKKVDSVAWDVPCVKIVDYPRFRWRGLLIDPARHFIPVADVKHYLDAMALHKLNHLQMHLTDHEGWRIEIKRYPKLTEIGSRHDRSGGPGGFYTQDDIREIVRYAWDRHITIVPEIEMPYHTGAAIVAYPSLGINTSRLAGLPPERRWGQTKGLIAPRETTVVFLQGVLAEVMQLFPSRFIHIGGDEANIKNWTDDREMRELMKKLGCKDAHALHSWFIQQMDGYLAGQGRRLIGWDEILQGGLAPGATVMSWRGVDGGITAAKAGHDVVMAPTSHTYFDYYQGPKEKEPRAIGGHIPIEKVYEFEPIPPELSTAEARHVLGGQAQLWGEFIATAAHRDYMTWPRGCALSEVLWSPRQDRKYDRFRGRLEGHLKRLDAAGVKYRPL